MAERLSFALNPNQLAIRNILSNKSFIEIEIYAISNEDPNRNQSCFKLESMKEGIHTFTDKPILGFFNISEDFEQHNGKVAYDPELGMEYWDNSKGEQILGFIREKDQKEIVEKDGLSWIRCTAMICTRYNFKQVKRLLKDRKKKVSVEVEILDSYIENGIQYITKFELLGITILGSKGGVPVKEGIPGAQLSVLDLMEKEPLNYQKQALAFAYAELNKEEDDKLANMTDDVENEKAENVNSEESTSTEESTVVNFAASDETNAEEGEDKKDEEGGEGHQQNNAAENNSDDSDKDEEDKKDGEDDDDEDDKDDDEDGDDDDKKDFKAQCDELVMKCQEYEKKCADYEARCAEYEATIAKCNEDLSRCSDYDEVKKECDSFRAELEALKQQEKDRVRAEQEAHLSKLSQHMGLSEEDVKGVHEKCAQYAFASLEEIDKEVAYIAWKKNFSEGSQDHFAVNIADSVSSAQPSREKMSISERLKKNIQK